MKIIIIDHEPYTARRAAHYYFNDFRSTGYEVEYWSVWKVFEYSKNLVYNHQEQDKAVIYFSDLDNLLLSLDKIDIKESFIFVDLRFKYDTYLLYKRLREKKIKWGRLAYYHNPVQGYLHGFTASSHHTLLYKIKFWIHTILTMGKSLNNWPLTKFLFRLNFDSTFYREYFKSHIQYLTGSSRIEISPSERNVSLNYFDVHEYNRQLKKPAYYQKPYIVFLDIYLGKHPDLEINNKPGYMDVNLYYYKMNNFFDKLENHYNKPVVIAAHPKSNYTTEFGSRVCIKNQTCNLVMHSDLVINHCSLSSSFALMAKKPLIHIYDSTFPQNAVLKPIYRIAQNISTQINSPIINIDDFSIADFEDNSVDEEAYDKVLKTFFLGENVDEKSDFDILKTNIQLVLNNK